MGFSFDTEIAEAAAPMLALFEGTEAPARGDWQTRRTQLDRLFAHEVPNPHPELTVTDYHLTTEDGSRILLRWYCKNGRNPGSAVFYIHGGGMIHGSVANFHSNIARYVADTGVPFLAVDYRLAPENPYPIPVEDCFAGMQWLIAHASDLGVDPSRVAVLGESAGGGLAAALALLGRDRGAFELAAQVLVYPMLDDRNVDPDPTLVQFATWTYDDNATGWQALLGEAAGGPDVSPYAAPARASQLAGLPRTYLEVGELDIFRDEGIDYARRLALAGVPIELHVHSSAPHGFDMMAPEAAITQRALRDRARVLRSI